LLEIDFVSDPTTPDAEETPPELAPQLVACSGGPRNTTLSERGEVNDEVSRKRSPPPRHG
jgi:hypothetical protein